MSQHPDSWYLLRERRPDIAFYALSFPFAMIERGYRLKYDWRVCEDTCTNILTELGLLKYTFSRSGKANVTVTISDRFESRKTFQLLRIFDHCAPHFAQPRSVEIGEYVTYRFSGTLGADCWVTWSVDENFTQPSKTPSLTWVFEHSGVYNLRSELSNTDGVGQSTRYVNVWFWFGSYPRFTMYFNRQNRDLLVIGSLRSLVHTAGIPGGSGIRASANKSTPRPRTRATCRNMRKIDNLSLS
ncbi:unnamed protein product [Dibothriocephalus latus]|uniref:PKD domain-containing protein n=1 Tax=Dibothriocephalus latus TaxID=60516 RepID=A0A3P7P272_DIBLA|nr:unnamed protein product [Dibothriocephalus latus]